ncbi:hypothetical protein, partial [Methylophaga sp. UBA678]
EAKSLGPLIQILVIGVIIYPIFYIWETEHIDNFCREIKPGMTDVRLMEVADEYHLKLSGLEEGYVEEGHWLAEVRAKSTFSDYRCAISGIANKVANARIIDEE